MKVIIEKKSFAMRCKCCGCVFTADGSDLIVCGINRNNAKVECPNCGCEIMVSVNGVMKDNVKQINK